MAKPNNSKRLVEFTYGGKKGLNKAFAALRKAGYLAEQNFTCCQSCGWSEVPDDANKVVFYHSQDTDNLKEDGMCYVSWKGPPTEILRIFTENGVETEWEGNEDRRIMIRIKPKK
jgi:hypothetical protein